MIAETIELPRVRLFERRCRRCKEVGTDFAPTAHYCRPCLRTMNAERHAQRMAAVRAGRDAAAAAAIEAAALARNPNTEHPLLSAMAAYMSAHGFGALHLAVTRLENDLARANRVTLAAEGWIA